MKLDELKDALHFQLDRYRDDEISAGVSIGITNEDGAWGFITNGMTPAEAVERIDSARSLWDLNFPHPHECEERTK
tara:strand:- start:866 stop:1093 length:228 start_codon:yes stop_codon:yes gene_type:complete